MMILSIAFVFFLIPEVPIQLDNEIEVSLLLISNVRTKGIPLESMDRLFSVQPVRRAHRTIHDEDLIREREFRHDADDAGMDVAKEKLRDAERSDSI